jgi:transcription elongation factor
MKPSMQQANAFLSGELLEGVRFRHNDYVRVINSPNSGDAGSLISIEELGTDPLFLIELQSRQDAKTRQSALELAEATSVR